MLATTQPRRHASPHCTPDPLLDLQEGSALPTPLVGSDFYYQLTSSEVLLLMNYLI